MSTSHPRSANPVAITLAPRSCPSCPIFATRMRGRRPALAMKSCTALCISAISFLVSLYSDTYAPVTMLSRGTCRPHTFSSAYEISPTVARASAASMASLRRFFERSLGGWLTSAAASVSASRACWTLAGSRVLRMETRRSTCFLRTSVLSITRVWIGSSFFGLYLLTPTITSLAESMRACLRAALSSMRILGIPDAMALAIPPNSSTSCTTFTALS
mmetsp:Transcript_23350/g.40186  ORF Transcript_23350/g.40186 Transcript_23350/m.40186 type:complete len:217 (-) Transcript_23350:847-1497(-)